MLYKIELNELLISTYAFWKTFSCLGFFSVGLRIIELGTASEIEKRKREKTKKTKIFIFTGRINVSP